MDKIIIYSRADLALMAARGAGAVPPARWLASMQVNIAGMVRDRPAVYRSFGPYWWAVKAQLVAANLMAGAVDADLLAGITTGNAGMDMAGAVAYHGFNLDQMRDGNTFAVDTESGNTVEYLLYDEELERVIAAG